MFIYLAGAMSYYDNIHKFELATDWRNEAVNKLKVCGYDDKDIFNPCIRYIYNKEYEPNGVVYQNLVYLKKANVIILNLNDIDKSYGTLFEIYYAFLNHIPVIAFGENVLYNNQPHVRASITMKFKTINDVVAYITSMYSVIQ